MSEQSILEYWPEGIAAARIPANNNVRMLQALLLNPAISATTAAQPGSPAEGDVYILPASPTGAMWVGFFEDDVVIYYNATWTAFTPNEGLRKFVEDEGEDWQFVGDSSGGWAPAGGGGGGSGTVTSVDVSGGTTGLTASGGPVTGSGTITLGGTLAMANGGTGAALTDPNADRILFWDDSAGAVAWLTVGSNLSITTTTLNATGGGTPAGADTQVQFNDGGSAFGGDSGLVYNKTTDTLTTVNLLTTTHTLTGLLLTAASASGSAGFRLPHGAAPSSPTNGDTWTTTAGMYVRINGVTVGPLAAAGGGSLTNWTEATTTLSGVTNSFTALNAGADVNAALIAKGTGATQAQIQTNSATGGNARGAYATDWQKIRTNADEVASGSNSSIGGGERNKASGNYSTIPGGFQITVSGQYSMASGRGHTVSQNYGFAIGNTCTVTALYAMAGGDGCTASGANSHAYGSVATADSDYSWAFGSRAHTKGVLGMRAWASGRFSADGDAQAMRCIQRIATTTATPAAATTNAAAAGTTNQVILENNSAAFVRARVLARRDNGNVKTWDVSYTVTRGANAASTAIAGTASVDVVDDPSTTGWQLAVTADTTNGGATVTVTGAASQNVKWVVDNYSIAYIQG